MTDEQKKDYFKSSIDDDEREDIAQANYEYGMEEGAAKTSREIAAKMKAKRIPMAEIAEITGLSEEEIAGLKAL